MVLGLLALSFPEHCSSRTGPHAERDASSPHHGLRSADPDHMALGKLSLYLTWGQQSLRPGLTSSVITQAHILGLGLAQPIIYPIYDLL